MINSIKKLMLSSICLASIFLSACMPKYEVTISKVNDTESEEEITQVEKEDVKEMLTCNFYDETQFNKYVGEAEAYNCEKKIRCGVVPHHLLAGKLIASFFYTASLKCDDIDTVVIVAPIHDPLGDTVCTTLKDWNTPFGTLKNDTEFSQEFISSMNAEDDDKMLTADHSASGLIPFVKYYFPSSSVSCVLVARTAEKDTPQKLSALLNEFSKKKNCLFIFSVDFSHYLAPENTEMRDQQTREAILNNDINSISVMTNDNMDSPYCIETFLRLTEKLNGEVSEFCHSNSLIISNRPYSRPEFKDGLTSYFIFAGTSD